MAFAQLPQVLKRIFRAYGILQEIHKALWVDSCPLDALLKKNSFQWIVAASKAFDELKTAVTKPLVLALPDFSKPFLIECDASMVGIRVVLMQEDKPLAYLSHALKGRALGLSTYKKELLALVYAVKKWRSCVLGKPFVVRTDQQSLKFLLEQQIGTPTQQKWISKLLGYDFSIEYKRGREDRAADALSRQLELEEGSSLAGITVLDPIWLQDLRASYKTDLELAEIC